MPVCTENEDIPSDALVGQNASASPTRQNRGVSRNDRLRRPLPSRRASPRSINNACLSAPRLPHGKFLPNWLSVAGLPATPSVSSTSPGHQITECASNAARGDNRLCEPAPPQTGEPASTRPSDFPRRAKGRLAALFESGFLSDQKTAGQRTSIRKRLSPVPRHRTGSIGSLKVKSTDHPGSRMRSEVGASWRSPAVASASACAEPSAQASSP